MMHRVIALRARGKRILFAQRRRWREGRVRVIWKIRTLAGLLRSSRSTEAYTSLVVVPTPLTSHALADAVARVNWQLPDGFLPVWFGQPSDDLPQVGPADAPSLDPALVHLPRFLAKSPGKRPYYLMRSVGVRALWAARSDLSSVSVVDPDAYGYFEDWEYRRLRERLLPDTYSTTLEAISRLFALKAHSALVMGTGPSAATFEGSSSEWDIRVLCNSAVRNRALLERIRPNIIAFADGVFHFGPSRYARAFRDDLLRAIDCVDPILVVPNDYLGLLIANYPDLANRTVGVDIGPSKWTVPSRESLHVRSTGNVLTYLMLPIAAALADRVDIAGCDGRQPGEVYFWKHGRSVQYGDELMQSAFDAHPAFFRDQAYEDYYERHCQEIEELILAVEDLGVNIRSITESHIPALSRRASTFI